MTLETEKDQSVRNAEILRLHLDGMENAKIAKQFNLTKQRVHILIKKAGIKGRKLMLEDWRREIAHLVKDGYTAKEIAALTGRTRSYVHSVTNDYGLKTNRVSKKDREEIDGLMELIKAGVTTINAMSGGDKNFREKLYREARRRGIELDHHLAKAARERKNG